jgi:hypothetical protein
MTPHAFYKGLLRDMRTHLGEPKTFCPNCLKPFPCNGDDYCSNTCAEDHDTVLNGGTPLPEHERCTCGRDAAVAAFEIPRSEPHLSDCRLYVPHPEDHSHPLENEP